MISEPKHISSTEAISAAFAAFVVSVKPHQPATDRPHQKADGKDRSGVEQLGGGVALGKEGFGEVQREGGVDVPVVPLDHVADRATENRFETAGGGFLASGSSSRPMGGGIGSFHGVPCFHYFLEGGIRCPACYIAGAVPDHEGLF